MRRAAFIHPRGAGQFRHLAASLAAKDWDVTILCESEDISLPGVRFRKMAPARAQPGEAPLAFAARYAQNGNRSADALESLARAEGRPDIVVGHAGWGDMVFAGDALPDTATLGYFEYFFRPDGGDVGFDPAEPMDLAGRRRLSSRNMAQLATLEAVTAGISPTQWQRSRFPGWGQRKIALCHDGISLEFCRPGRPAPFVVGGRTIDPDMKIVTFAARGLEPYRGFPQFMRAAAKVAAKQPEVLFVVAGGDEVFYGGQPKTAANWREAMMAETGLGEDRIVFAGHVDHATLIRLFQVSAAHVYLTVPFVLSWSVLEAMACGALVIGSATAPVEEVIEDGRNGLLSDFWDSDALAERIREAIIRPDRFLSLRQAARHTIAGRYALDDCVGRQEMIINQLLN